MALILNIDSSVEAASMCLAKDSKIISIASNPKQKDHASWLHVAIKKMFEENKMDLNAIEAIAVTGGPGSYTGLRIGMSAAKGICYASKKPMIVLNTLLVMANAARSESADLLCPMIDARRMEVFTAIYSKDLQLIKEPQAMTLHETSFDEELKNNRILFFGNGSFKFSSIKKHPQALFREISFDASDMVALSEKKFEQKEFADLAYAEPLYLKEFYTPSR